ncbi:hypothetical protein DFA_05031 [Cavenderia fasciculata]|uniref:Uncharacterized protein n=1 Tax=Cavenderia fasciculata TaxID=261658 RepID=F4PN08_CACFS|nr:uncharacterized protein DFA_05031 [Cavenderia fasciculata]EGG22901.1 hypothetical protein DFA_05031 [Cavenderia fasciculata]|eukprot:XP_004360752.1 hypothetical protein DFA_05031 [Cavenderia fasciculata]
MDRDHPIKNFNASRTSLIDNKYKDQLELLHNREIRQIKTEYFIKPHCIKDNDHKDMLDSIIWQFEGGYPFENSHKRSLQLGYIDIVRFYRFNTTNNNNNNNNSIYNQDHDEYEMTNDLLKGLFFKSLAYSNQIYNLLSVPRKLS